MPDVASNDTSGVPAAAAAAAAADLVVLAIGSDLMLERETLDRVTIDFSAGQKTLISAVAAAAKGPVVALVFCGGAMDVSSLLANPDIDAVIHAGQPSTQVLPYYYWMSELVSEYISLTAGQVMGTADVIFGSTPDGRQRVAVAGRMSQTIYPAAFAGQVSMFDFGMVCAAYVNSRHISCAYRSIDKRNSFIPGSRCCSAPAHLRGHPAPTQVARTVSTRGKPCCPSVMASYL